MIYGTTRWGGFGYGNVYSYDLNTSIYTDLVDFDAYAMGANPYDLIQSSDGMLYGFSHGPNFTIYSDGAFFKIDPESGVFTKLLSLGQEGIGRSPHSLITAANGHIYLISGELFWSTYGLLEYDPFSILLYQRYLFEDESSGQHPYFIMPLTNGKLIGETSSGGANGMGVLFEYDPVSMQYTKKVDLNDTITLPATNGYGSVSNSPFVALSANPPQAVDFHLKVYLEGPFYGTGMTPAPESVLPLEQPFNTAPWNYFANDSIPSIPINVVDWVLVELRLADSANHATPLSVIARKPGLLLTNGRIKDPANSLSDLQFDLFDNQDVYIVVYQRNHLPLMSSTALNGSGGTIFYNFTTADSKAYGDNAEKELTAGIFGMYGGDANSDFVIDSADQVEAWLTEVGHSGYIPSDFNGDAQADNRDKNDVLLQNSGVVSQLPATDDCGFYLIDTRDAHSYPTVKIGTQCWMASNLDVGLVLDESVNQSNNGIIEQYCTSDCNYINKAIVNGGLYQWDEMMQYDTIEGLQGICPDGWHIPSDADWCLLEQSIDSTVDCSSGGWRGTDIGIKLSMSGGSGFDAFLNGYRQLNSPYFIMQDTQACFWSSTKNTGLTPWYRKLDISQPGSFRGSDMTTSYGLSVRCTRN